MTKDEFRKKYKLLYPNMPDSEVDEVYDRAASVVNQLGDVAKNSGVWDSFSQNSQTASNAIPDAKENSTLKLTPDDLKQMDWQEIATVIVTSTISRYIYAYTLKVALSKATGRKVTFKQVYWGISAGRQVARLMTETVIGRSRYEVTLYDRLKAATNGKLFK